MMRVLSLAVLLACPALLPIAGAPRSSFLASSYADTPAAPSVRADVVAECWFSPKGGCTDAVVEALGRAKNEVLVQGYSFTSAPIADALIAAHKRGVTVRVVLDKGQLTAHDSLGTKCRRAGVEVTYDHSHAIAHNKVMVIDGLRTLTGSFNFTAAAEEHNAENLVHLEGPGVAKAYRDNWLKHRAHAEPPSARAAEELVTDPAPPADANQLLARIRDRRDKFAKAQKEFADADRTDVDAFNKALKELEDAAKLLGGAPSAVRVEEAAGLLRGKVGPPGPPGPVGPPGRTPAHQWSGTSLQFANPDGSWGPFVDLKGAKGDPGGPPAPPPADDLVASLQAAWKLESEADRAKIADLANSYLLAATRPSGLIYTPANDTALKVHGVFKASRDALLGPALPYLHDAVTKYVTAAMVPDPQNKPLDDAARDRMAAVFTRVGNALKELK